MSHDDLAFRTEKHGRFYVTPEVRAGISDLSRFDVVEAYRRGDAVPAMTSVLSGKFQSDAAKELREWFAGTTKEWGRLSREIAQESKGVDPKEARSAGNNVHAAIDVALSRGRGGCLGDVEHVGSALPGYSGTLYQGFRSFTELWAGASIVTSEQTYYVDFGDNVRFAGTTDAVVRQGDRLVSLDWKTGKAAPSVLKALLQASGIMFAGSFAFQGRSVQVTKALPGAAGVVWLRSDGGVEPYVLPSDKESVFKELSEVILRAKVEEFNSSMGL